MDIVSDYGNWKFENFNLIDNLVKANSDIIRRFPHVILICDYFYDKVTNESYKLKNEEEVIFETAFNYLYDHFSTISLILERDFNNNVDEMNKFAKTINLLLYTNDFQSEINNNDPKNQTNIAKLNDFENRVLKFIETHTNAPDEMFAVLSDITTPIFDDDFMSVNEILYQVAEELGIAPDESDTNEINFTY